MYNFQSNFLNFGIMPQNIAFGQQRCSICGSPTTNPGADMFDYNTGDCFDEFYPSNNNGFNNNPFPQMQNPFMAQIQNFFKMFMSLLFAIMGGNRNQAQNQNNFGNQMNQTPRYTFQNRNNAQHRPARVRIIKIHQQPAKTTNTPKNQTAQQTTQQSIQQQEPVKQEIKQEPQQNEVIDDAPFNLPTMDLGFDYNSNTNRTSSVSFSGNSKQLPKFDIDLSKLDDAATSSASSTVGTDKKAAPAPVRTNVPQNGVTDTNGQIDRSFQQSSTGDCWLLSGIQAMAEKENSRNYLNSLLSVDQNTGDVTVNLKGVNKSYKVSKAVIDESTALSKGDGDVRAIELAIGQYIIDSGERNTGDISSALRAHPMQTAYKYLVGNGTMLTGQYASGRSYFGDGYKSYNEVIKDFNNENKAFSFCVSPDNVPTGDELRSFPVQNAETNESTNLIANHAYSVVKSDDQFVYFRNPHDTSQLLKCNKNLLTQHKAYIDSTTIQ